MPSIIKYRNTGKLKVKLWERRYHVNIKEKKAGLNRLQGKKNYQRQTLYNDKKSVHQKDVVILNIYYHTRNCRKQ